RNTLRRAVVVMYVGWLMDVSHPRYLAVNALKAHITHSRVAWVLVAVAPELVTYAPLIGLLAHLNVCMANAVDVDGAVPHEPLHYAESGLLLCALVFMVATCAECDFRLYFFEPILNKLHLLLGAEYLCADFRN